MLNYFFQTCFYLAPFLLTFFGLAAIITLIGEAILL
jgi:hypothetical protein